jgi:tetratricopeptide (TPR) repeat protein
MKRTTDLGNKKSGKRWVAFALLLVICFLIYSNTFEASWHFDDVTIILNNPRINISDLQPETVLQTFFASLDGGLYLGKRLYRPVSCFSFALNWYIGQNDVTGYHLVNLAAHIFTAFILYLTILGLFRSPRLSGQHNGSENFIALLTAVLWATNPIQSQAVAYIVQRMAVLAAMFYVLSIYLYLQARIRKTGRKQFLFFGGCILSFLLALGSKENAATLPLALLLLELIFFQNLSRLAKNKTFLWGAIIFGFFAALCVLFFFYQGKFSSVMAAYNARSFSLMQRLMTQPGILVFYLSQIFYPLPSRLSIEHDIAVSTSCFSPWTTLPSIIIIVLLIGLGFSLARKKPILSFAILFFFLNHLIESTIFPLELMFEHRNYLPSLYLFFPVAVGIKWLLNQYKEKKRLLHVMLVSCLTMLIVFLCIGTYLRNMTWATEKTLWEDAVQKAPGRARPYQNLAAGYYGKIGDYRKAFDLYEKALELEGSQPVYSKIASLGNMARISYKEGEYQKAMELCKNALDLYPHYRPALRVMVMCYAALGNWLQASKSAELLLSKNYLSKDYRILYGFSLLKIKKYDMALTHFRNTLRMYPGEKKLLYNIGVTLSFMQYYDRADLFLKLAKQRSSNSILIDLFLIENAAKAGDHHRTQRYLEHLFADHSIQKIATAANGTVDDSLIVTFTPELIAPLVAKKIKEHTRELEAIITVRQHDVLPSPKTPK